MTTKEIEIKKKIYEIVDGTQSDGRCFSAAIYYVLFNVKADDNDLNIWIQTNIINPIIETENTDCIKFLKWAMIWSGLPKHNTNHKDGERNFPAIDEDVRTTQQIMDRLQIDINNIEDAITHTENETQLIVIINELIASLNIFNDRQVHIIAMHLSDTRPKQFEDNFGNLYYSNELTNFIHN